MSIKSKLHEIKESFRGKTMAPAFNAFHTFLFTPNDVTSTGTHIKVADDLKRTMNTVIMSLVPCLIFGIFNAGYQHNLAIDAANGITTQASLFGNFLTFDNLMIGSMKVLPLVIVSYVVGLTVEFIFAVIKGHEVIDLIVNSEKDMNDNPLEKIEMTVVMKDKSEVLED